MLKAIALSVKATGTVNSITIGGKLVTSGSNVATLEVEGTVDSSQSQAVSTHRSGPMPSTWPTARSTSMVSPCLPGPVTRSSP